MTHLRQLTERTHNVRLRIELARFGVEFTANDVLVDTGVTDDLHFVDRGRLAFVHAHLKINGVVRHVHLDRLDVEEQVTAVGVELAHRVVVSRQTVVQRLEVIHIARLDTQHSVQIIIGIDCVTDPFDRADVVLVAFADRHVHIHARRVFGVRNNAVRYDIRIAVTVLVVFLDDRLFVLLVFLDHELLRAEQVDDIIVVRFLHRLVDLAMR